MTHPTNTGARVNPNNPLVTPLIENAIAVAYSIALVKAPVRFVQDSMLAKLSGFLRYIADKSARGVSTALGSAVNNKLTRRISPSVASSLDDKLKNVCTVSGRWAGNVLSFPGTAAFYLVAAAYASVVAVAAVVVLIAKYMFEAVWYVTVGSRKEIYNDAFLETKKEAASCKNMVSNAAYMLCHTSLRLILYGVIEPVVILAVVSLTKILSLVAAPFSAPVYMLSSVFGLDNRFNIYKYENGVGLIHGLIQDMVEKKYDGGFFLPDYAYDRLIEEATTRGIDKPNTVNTEQASTELISLTVERGAQQQQVSAA